MGIKTFNIDEEIYNEYRKLCKANGLSMSKQIEIFLASQVAKGKQRRKLKDQLEGTKKGEFSKEDLIEEVIESIKDRLGY